MRKPTKRKLGVQNKAPPPPKKKNKALKLVIHCHTLHSASENKKDISEYI